MTIEEIMEQHAELNKELQISLSTMERKSKIFEIREQLIAIQNICPHYSKKYNFSMIEGHCPYCGKKLEESRNY